MDKDILIIQKIKEQAFLPLFYNDDVEVCIAVTKALYDAGVRCIEFTNRGSKAAVNFVALVREKNNSMPDMYLGIGTIKTSEEAIGFIDAGADFLVSPIFDAGICEISCLHKILWIPGCMTVTEIDTAQKAGFNLIKLFPGNVLGSGFVEAVMPLFNGLDFIITGGVDTTAENLNTWFTTGIAAVGIGSKLITSDILQHKNYNELKKRTMDVMAILQNIK